jgi:hypothetical protein
MCPDPAFELKDAAEDPRLANFIIGHFSDVATTSQKCSLDFRAGVR